MMNANCILKRTIHSRLLIRQPRQFACTSRIVNNNISRNGSSCRCPGSSSSWQTTTAPLIQTHYYSTTSSFNNPCHVKKNNTLLVRSSEQRSISTFPWNLGGPPDWHQDDFLSDATVEEKVEWLSSLLQSSNAEHVDTEAYLVVLRALAESFRPDAPFVAERWLSRLETHAAEQEDGRQSNNENDQPKVVLTSECYRLVIAAWRGAIREDPELRVVRSERLLKKHIDSPDERLRPDTKSFNAFLDLCSFGAEHKKGKDHTVLYKLAKKGEEYLNYMIRQRRVHGSKCWVSPNIDSFIFVMRGWGNRKEIHDTLTHVQRVFRNLEEYGQSVDPTVQADHKSYGILLDAYATKAKLNLKNCRPKKFKDPLENGLVNIHKIQWYIDGLKTKVASGRIDLEPTTVHYNTLIKALSYLSSPIHPDAPMEAEKILQRMIVQKDKNPKAAAPDATTYGLVQRTWANSEAPNRGERVQWWLDKLWADYEFEGRDSLRPKVDNYNEAIRVWSKMHEPFKAEQAISKMLDQANSCPANASILSPNNESFSFVIWAWIRFAKKGSIVGLTQAIKWLNLLREFEKDDASRLSTVWSMYNGIIDAAQVIGPHYPEIFKDVVGVFEQFRASHHKVHYSEYLDMLRVTLVTLTRPENDEERTEYLRQLTKDCCEAGLLSTYFIRSITDGPTYETGWTLEESDKMTKELFPEWPLPASWSRNLNREKFLPKESDLVRTKELVGYHGTSFARRLYRID